MRLAKILPGLVDILCNLIHQGLFGIESDFTPQPVQEFHSDVMMVKIRMIIENEGFQREFPLAESGIVAYIADALVMILADPCPCYVDPGPDQGHIVADGQVRRREAHHCSPLLAMDNLS